MAARLEAIASQRPSAPLLEHRDELLLDRTQVTRLEAIDRRVREANRTVFDTHFGAAEAPAKAAAGPPTGERPGSRERLNAFRMAMVEMRRNLTDAREEAMAILTPEQQRRAREIAERRSGTR